MPAVAFDTRILPAPEAVPPIVLLDDSMTIPEPSKLTISRPSIVLPAVARQPRVRPSAALSSPPSITTRRRLAQEGWLRSCRR